MFAQLEDQACGQERMAAQIEEVVVDTNTLDFQNLRPQARKLFFQLCSRRDEGIFISLATGLCEFSKTPAIDLFVRRSRTLLAS